MPRLFYSVVAVGLLGSLMVGCVPYQKYKDLEKELARAKEVNADMIKKYNQLLLKKGDDLSPEERKQLMARISELQGELASRPAFDRNEAPGDTFIDDGGIAMGDSLLFDEGRADLKRSAYPVLDELVDLLRSQKYSDEVFIVEGHTDIQPLRRTKAKWILNMNLAYQRAWAVLKYLNTNGVPENRLIVHSYSFNKPMDLSTMHTAEGKRLNRRVVVRRAGTRPTVGVGMVGGRNTEVVGIEER